ncbi:polysaccharide biosynthesis tyrosine autokinase [Pedobacter sp. MC2016-24]|uniref:GumC family protein n=1 Tax=Pedobacter sp. MC2016-24 TaxID=2780090 RepID=UPI001D164896|nr:polysaccharide biosynthesis tyrosine autokinase [Pedobacter sp. MC2016-24]
MMKYVRNWYLFVIVLAMSVGGAYLYLECTVPLYKVTSTLQIQEDTKGDGLFKGTAFSDLNMFKTSKTVENEMEVLRSRDLIYNVLAKLGFETRYYYKNIFRNEELYGNNLPLKVKVVRMSPQGYQSKIALSIINDQEFLLTDGVVSKRYNFNQNVFGKGYQIVVTKGPAFEIADEPVQIRFVNLYRAAEAYSMTGLTILPVIKDANTIVLSLLDPIPDRGIQLLNTLINTYNMENVRSKNIMALNTIKFIDNKLRYLTKDLSGVEQEVQNYKQNNSVTELATDAQMSLQSSGAYNQQLAASEVQLSLVESITGYLNGSGSTFDMVPTTLGLKDPTLQGLTERYNSLQLERERLLRTTNVNNPLVQNITAQLQSLKSNLLENLSMIKKGLVVEKNSLNNKSQLYESKLRNVPVIERGLIERGREQGVRTTLYQYLLQKREETELSLSATIPSSLMIDKPAYNGVPAKPKVQLIYMLSIIFGLVIPASVIYGRDKLNAKVNDILDVEYLNGNIRILGELSHKKIGESIVVHKDKSTTISELFRYIRSNLHFMDADKNNKVFLVTSSTKGEGKTFFCANLGITLSLIDKKVVLLEFDLRKPDLVNSLKMSPGPGLSEYLADDKLKLDDIIVQSNAADSLYVIGCGKIPHNPSELLMSDRLNILFEELRTRFDYIILDTSPVGYVADAFSLAPFSDASIYLVRYNYTDKRELGIFEDICENNRLKNPMLVFNDAKKGNRNVHRYGRYAYPA